MHYCEYKAEQTFNCLYVPENINKKCGLKVTSKMGVYKLLVKS